MPKKDSNNASAAPRAPEGFQLTQAADRHWWSPLDEEERPNPIQGVAISRVERHDGAGWQYVFRLTAPTHAKNGDGVWSERQAGELVFVDERHQLADLQRQMSDSPTYLEFYIQPLGKRKIDNGNREVHKFNLYTKPTSEARPRLPSVVVTGQLEGPQDDNDPIPFG